MQNKKKSLRVGVVRFPCSNCDFDTLRFFIKFGHRPEFIWHNENFFSSYDLLVIPGGFAFGDRVYKKATGKYEIDPGVQALRSPIMKAIYDFAKKGRPILGICNGFQILVKAGLLPGKLTQNNSQKFFCDFTICKITGDSFFGDKKMLGKKFKVPVAHGYGKYVVNDKEYKRLQKNKQIFLEYQNFNPNGSVRNVAGVTNKEKTIFGMMPHPERTPDGKFFMRAIETYVKN
ncbi:phosphoribosylformylglycinamidine synthase I [Candidatus Roizmanbacteria bacterium RIFCSPLOWO2_12_FULL_40_12]|uniref:Phosphoribosylformylglycinamidine synthase subunit PurQ n=1 Tax=Candidatus Roizmanbacteria bacterium RIFCSPLOWO2_01_FULL_40_42 TaxID=1802066 RepID=A0A1F7J6S5_9BACT|nr:MAG: phosphoribosylformylglycinamidine synthase I [Candidatus Roizmanbacteria bacterium RIFCSPHIGHO2_01_FULL_40_98]OGK27192.1 MAG: phosphoribosylformylglycinamidine synthase I [Candidatus Roizmanbacteria bacterium RIFCSPHIGHO2_02_FULL_40_53]OGK30065.1 MAG: phosphoribosylformylglycinamidine synthase I [Candidatus Roizmanbacteria bacterium RIFCSPHIGHO2_12_41_18]OGK36065.1 MAG: phosphoribosylformylglycinamidine synthase I [Candidatus Roizmanbacteria bacterium RIFCSPHIGHO2_12_FULL_40_130]OGK5130